MTFPIQAPPSEAPLPAAGDSPWFKTPGLGQYLSYFETAVEVARVDGIDGHGLTKVEIEEVTGHLGSHVQPRLAKSGIFSVEERGRATPENSSTPPHVYRVQKAGAAILRPHIAERLPRVERGLAQLDILPRPKDYEDLSPGKASRVRLYELILTMQQEEILLAMLNGHHGTAEIVGATNFRPGTVRNAAPLFRRQGLTRTEGGHNNTKTFLSDDGLNLMRPHLLRSYVQLRQAQVKIGTGQQS